MENFKYLINNISSQVFHIKKVNSELKESLEKVKEMWEQLKGTQDILPSDLSYVGDNLFIIAFRDFAIINKYIKEFTYMIKTVNPEDIVKIRDIQEMNVKIVRLYDKATIISKTITTMIRELNIACRKELDRMSKSQKNN